MVTGNKYTGIHGFPFQGSLSKVWLQCLTWVYCITSQQLPKSLAEVERNEKNKKRSFHKLKEFEMFSSVHPRMQTGTGPRNLPLVGKYLLNWISRTQCKE